MKHSRHFQSAPFAEAPGFAAPRALSNLLFIISWRNNDPDGKAPRFHSISFENPLFAPAQPHFVWSGRVVLGGPIK